MQTPDVPAEQAWFWTSEWQAGEAEADADIAAGRMTRTSSDAEFFQFLDQLDTTGEDHR